MSQPIVDCRGIKKSYGKLIAIDTLNLEIEAGQFVVLLGPSGSGKSTLLSILGGFTKPSEGRLLINGNDVTDLRPSQRPTVTVFQDYALFPHMSVHENIAFGLTMRKVPKSTRERSVTEVLATVGLVGLGDRYVHELSGGQRQRVALARAIVVEPSLLLLDEPLGALDLKIRQQMQYELVELQRRIKTTFVHVTHDQEEAMNIADIVIVINEGKVEDIGPPERVYLTPSSRFTANFMGESNIVPCTSVDMFEKQTKVQSEFGEFIVTGNLERGQKGHISIRPEHVRIDNPLGSTHQFLGMAVVHSSAFQGAYRRYIARSDFSGTDLHIRTGPEQKVETDKKIKLYAEVEKFVLLTK